jgi:hypothetical protein
MTPTETHKTTDTTHLTNEKRTSDLGPKLRGKGQNCCKTLRSDIRIKRRPANRKQQSAERTDFALNGSKH